MSQTDNASSVALFIAYFFGGAFISVAIPAMMAKDHATLAFLYPIGYGIFFAICLVLLIGVWLDGWPDN